MKTQYTNSPYIARSVYIYHIYHITSKYMYTSKYNYNSFIYSKKKNFLYYYYILYIYIVSDTIISNYIYLSISLYTYNSIISESSYCDVVLPLLGSRLGSIGLILLAFFDLYSELELVPELELEPDPEYFGGLR